jgi:hypothetical protein
MMIFRTALPPPYNKSHLYLKTSVVHTHNVSMDGKITTYPYECMKLDIVMTDHQRNGKKVKLSL